MTFECSAGVVDAVEISDHAAVVPPSTLIEGGTVAAVVIIVSVPSRERHSVMSQVVVTIVKGVASGTIVQTNRNAIEVLLFTKMELK